MIVIFYSCGRKGINERDDTGSIIVIDLFSESESEITMASDILTDLDYISLQTTENALVGSITKIVTRDNKIYIKNSIDEILCFDNGGKFLNKLEKIGRGPEEYTFIADFDVSSDNKTLIILSSGKILIFKNTGDEFLFNRSIKLMRPFPSKIDMIPGTNNLLMSVDPTTGNEPSLSLLINLNGDTLYFKPNYYKFEKVDKFTRGMANESIHYDFASGICFKEEFSDTVFIINKESKIFQPRMIFDSRGKGFSPRIRYDTEYARNNANDLYWVYSIMEIPRYIIYTYQHNKSRNKMIYDKSTNKKFKIALKDALKDDIVGGPVFDPDYCNEGKLCSSVDALTLKKYVAGEEFINSQVKDTKKKEELKKLANYLNEFDNPVLIVAKSKNLGRDFR